MFKNFIKKISSWYFSKNVLPYWAILLADSAIIFLSCILTYWLGHRTQLTFDNRYPVAMTALM